MKMREMLNDSEMEQVAGGIVTINRSRMSIGFASSGESYGLQCSFGDARSFAEELKVENPSLSNAEFEALVKSEFRRKGWIS
jgi:hypothetical protein